MYRNVYISIELKFRITSNQYLNKTNTIKLKFIKHYTFKDL